MPQTDDGSENSVLPKLDYRSVDRIGVFLSEKVGECSVVEIESAIYRWKALEMTFLTVYSSCKTTKRILSGERSKSGYKSVQNGSKRS
jgi:hypothetical protein